MSLYLLDFDKIDSQHREFSYDFVLGNISSLFTIGQRCYGYREATNNVMWEFYHARLYYLVIDQVALSEFI